MPCVNQSNRQCTRFPNFEIVIQPLLIKSIFGQKIRNFAILCLICVRHCKYDYIIKEVVNAVIFLILDFSYNVMELFSKSSARQSQNQYFMRSECNKCQILDMIGVCNHIYWNKKFDITNLSASMSSRNGACFLSCIPQTSLHICSLPAENVVIFDLWVLSQEAIIGLNLEFPRLNFFISQVPLLNASNFFIYWISLSDGNIYLRSQNGVEEKSKWSRRKVEMESKKSRNGVEEKVEMESKWIL